MMKKGKVIVRGERQVGIVLSEKKKTCLMQFGKGRDQFNAEKRKAEVELLNGAGWDV